MGTDIVPVGLDKTDSVDGYGSYQTTFVAVPPADAVVTDHPHSYVHRRRIRGGIVHTPMINGWRDPSAYVSAAVRRTSKGFDLINISPLKGPGAIDRIKGDSRPISGTVFGTAPNDNTFFNAQGVPYVTANTVVRAETEAMEKLRSSKVDIGTSLAEAKRTIDEIARIAVKLAALYNAVRHGRFEHARQILFGSRGITPANAGEAWLTWAYGIKPLMADIYGLNEALKQGLRPDGLIIRVERTVRTNVTPIYLKSGNWSQFEYKGKVEELAKCILYAQIDASWGANLSSLGLINPYSVAWELTGWSFLLDYLMPIGTWLSALTASAGISFRSGTLTKRVHADLTFRVLPKVSGTVLVGKWCETRYQCLATHRKVYGAFPTPWVYIKSPFSDGHLANMAALIAAATGGGRRR